ncbi:hypothetical protein [Streptomyces sp. NPDC005533]|uniref:hypothetical protein n=1 Tax=Streptomyces sp. NPDC005533 TaxID=3364723 RepID=UPI0036AEE097
MFTQAQFETADEVRGAHGAQVFANPRKCTAGTLRPKDRAYRLAMTFQAYGAGELVGVALVPSGAPHAEAGVQPTADAPAGCLAALPGTSVDRAPDRMNFVKRAWTGYVSSRRSDSCEVGFSRG